MRFAGIVSRATATIARGIEASGKEDEYIYAFGDGNQFTFGVEAEDFADTVAVSELIAGYDHDPSLGRMQSNILDCPHCSSS